jgi:phospholipid/cholesterol/gamma-HCH transport system substrate-binding protein
VGQRLPGMMQRADATLANTETLTQNLSQIDVEAMVKRIDATLANVEQMSAALTSREGSIGLLLHDPQLYQNLTATMRDVDSLLVDFKQHPRRYINVSVFGKKDK